MRGIHRLRKLVGKKVLPAPVLLGIALLWRRCQGQPCSVLLGAVCGGPILLSCRVTIWVR